MTLPQKLSASGLSVLSVSITLALTVLASQAHGQSLVALYQSALSYDANYQSAKLQYDASVARADQAKAGILPSAGLSAGVSRIGAESNVPAVSTNYTTQNATLSAIQPLYRPANWAAYEQGAKLVDLAGAQHQLFAHAAQHLGLAVRNHGHADLLHHAQRLVRRTRNIAAQAKVAMA